VQSPRRSGQHWGPDRAQSGGFVCVCVCMCVCVGACPGRTSSLLEVRLPPAGGRAMTERVAPPFFRDRKFVTDDRESLLCFVSSRAGAAPC